jgi:hypothetical protein
MGEIETFFVFLNSYWETCVGVWKDEK